MRTRQLRRGKLRLKQQGRLPTTATAPVRASNPDEDDPLHIDDYEILKPEEVSRPLSIEEDEEAEEDSDFHPLLEELFNEEEFRSRWKEIGEKMYPEVRDVLVTHYSFADLLMTLESGLRNNIDKQLVVLDGAMEKELVAMTSLKLVLLYARHLFSDSTEFAKIMRYLLTPEVQQTSAKRRHGDPSETIRQMYDMLRKTNSPKSTSNNAENNKPVGFTRRSSTSI